MVAFVPVVHSTPSPRAEALGQRLAETIEQYRQQNPDLSGLDVRQATEIALSRAGGASTAKPALIAVAVALAAAGLAFALAADKGIVGGDKWMPMLLIAAIALVLGVVAVLKRRG
jgi:hypothetical protein